MSTIIGGMVFTFSMALKDRGILHYIFSRALEETGSFLIFLTTSFPVPFLYNACAYFTFTILLPLIFINLSWSVCAVECVVLHAINFISVYAKTKEER